MTTETTPPILTPPTDGAVTPPETPPPAPSAPPADPAFAPPTDAPAPNDMVGAPAEGTYGDFTIPEGREVNEELLTQFRELASSMNLSQSGAQKLVDVYAAELQRAEETSQAEWEATQNEWHKSWARDPVIGGPKLAENVQRANDVMTRYADPGLVTLLSEMGITKHPLFVRFVHSVAQQIGEPPYAPGVTSSASGARDFHSVAKSLYPSTADIQ